MKRNLCDSHHAHELRPAGWGKRVNLVIQFENRGKLSPGLPRGSHAGCCLCGPPLITPFCHLQSLQTWIEDSKAHEAPSLSYLQSQGKHGKYINIKFLFLCEIQALFASRKDNRIKSYSYHLWKKLFLLSSEWSRRSFSLKVVQPAIKPSRQMQRKKCLWFARSSTCLGCFCVIFSGSPLTGWIADPEELPHTTHFCFVAVCPPKARCPYEALLLWWKRKDECTPRCFCSCSLCMRKIFLAFLTFICVCFCG